MDLLDMCGNACSIILFFKLPVWFVTFCNRPGAVCKLLATKAGKEPKNRQHYHCPYCRTAICRKAHFLHHLKLSCPVLRQSSSAVELPETIEGSVNEFPLSEQLGEEAHERKKPSGPRGVMIVDEENDVYAVFQHGGRGYATYVFRPSGPYGKVSNSRGSFSIPSKNK